jgi:hypothetical protein
MPKQPGNLDDLNASGRAEWDAQIAQVYSDAIQTSGTRHFVAAPTPAMTAPPDLVDWDGIPVRVQACLKSRNKAMQLSDWTTGSGDRGRSVCHEEYMEWRTVRNPSGKIIRVEITTEVQEYWITLARHHPVRLLSLVARFAGEPSVPYPMVYGSVNPNGPGVTPGARESGFRSMMLPNGGGPPLSPYNNGQKGICFLYQGVNALAAAVYLAAYAAFPYAAADAAGNLRPLTGSEAIASTQQSAVDCRNSDPTIVGGVLGQAFQGRQIALDDPPGISITQVDTERLRQPNGDPVPEEWFNLQRGIPSADGRPRTQRLALEVPADLPFEVGDLTDSATGETIEWGWQVAQLVKVGVYVRIGGTVEGDPTPVALQPTANCAEEGCGLFRAEYDEFEQSQPQPVAPTGGAGGPVAMAAEAVPRPTRVRGQFV